MEQRDILKDQIEELGRVLGKIIADFLGLKEQGNITQGIIISTQQLKSSLAIDLELLLSKTNAELLAYLQERNLSFEHIETLANHLAEIGTAQMDVQQATGIKLLQKVLEIYHLINTHTKLYSLDRMNRSDKIKQLMHQHLKND